MPNHRIAGEWRGHYQYRHAPDEGSPFSAFFSQTAGAIKGTILDDFMLGKATFTGTFSYPSVQFTKVYVNSARTPHPVDYQGTMSEDGKTMSGTWTIVIDHLSNSGTWSAHRFDEEAKDEEIEETKELTQPVSGEIS